MFVCVRLCAYLSGCAVRSVTMRDVLFCYVGVCCCLFVCVVSVFVCVCVWLCVWLCLLFDWCMCWCVCLLVWLFVCVIV